MDCVLIPGKVALVTGSSRGLGRAIARRLALSGADIVLHDVDEAAASRFGEASGPEEVMREFVEMGRQCHMTFGDLTDRAACDAVAKSALDRFGKIDILVNCAGGDIGASGNKPVPNECIDIPDEDVRCIMDRNLTSTMNMTRALVHSMMDAGSGSIINIASFAGMTAATSGSIYAIAKAGVIHWTRCLAAQLLPNGISVNCISPGETRTARFLATRSNAPEKLAETGRLTRLGEPDDVAKAVLFFASPLADYISGQNLVVDGGKGEHH